MSTFDDQKKDYQRAFRRFGHDPRSLQWVSQHSVDIRFEQFLKELDFNHKSVLDVGSGFGDLIDSISRQAQDFSYLGVDIVPEFITQAQKNHPGYRFVERNYLDYPLENIFDIVIASGCLNFNQGLNTLSYRQHYIQILFNHCSYALAFNMAGYHPQPSNHPRHNIYYVDSLNILTFCQNLTPKIIFKQHYDPLDFTLILFR